MSYTNDSDSEKRNLSSTAVIALLIIASLSQIPAFFVNFSFFAGIFLATFFVYFYRIFCRNVFSEKSFVVALGKYTAFPIILFGLFFIPQYLIISLVHDAGWEQMYAGPDLFLFSLPAKMFLSYPTEIYSNFYTLEKLYVGIFFVHSISFIGVLICDVGIKHKSPYNNLSYITHIGTRDLIAMIIATTGLVYWIIISAVFASIQHLNVSTLSALNAVFVFAILIILLNDYTHYRYCKNS